MRDLFLFNVGNRWSNRWRYIFNHLNKMPPYLFNTLCITLFVLHLENTLNCNTHMLPVFLFVYHHICKETLEKKKNEWETTNKRNMMLLLFMIITRYSPRIEIQMLSYVTQIWHEKQINYKFTHLLVYIYRTSGPETMMSVHIDMMWPVL